MEALLLALSPFVVKLITNALKPIEKINLSQDEKDMRRLGVRTLAVFLSLATAIVASLLSPEGFHVAEIGSVLTTLVETGLVFLAATGVYFFEKKNKSSE